MGEWLAQYGWIAFAAWSYWTVCHLADEVVKRQNESVFLLGRILAALEGLSTDVRDAPAALEGDVSEILDIARRLAPPPRHEWV